MSIRKRIRFEKYGMLKFIGHLDIMRAFQRICRRADVPIAYSQGFNPHPLMNFANPLSLGMTSEDEYMEVQLEKEMDNELIIEKMNEQCPEGINITGCWDLKEGMPACMAIVSAAKYRIEMPPQIDDWTQILYDFMGQPQIMLKKLGKVKGRKQWVEIDCKPLIYEWSVEDHGRVLYLTCACGSNENLKTDAMLESLYRYIDHMDYQFDEKIHRLNIYQTIGDDFVSLAEMRR